MAEFNQIFYEDLGMVLESPHYMIKIDPRDPNVTGLRFYVGIPNEEQRFEIPDLNMVFESQSYDLPGHVPSLDRLDQNLLCIHKTGAFEQDENIMNHHFLILVLKPRILRVQDARSLTGWEITMAPNQKNRGIHLKTWVGIPGLRNFRQELESLQSRVILLEQGSTLSTYRAQHIQDMSNLELDVIDLVPNQNHNFGMAYPKNLEQDNPDFVRVFFGHSVFNQRYIQILNRTRVYRSNIGLDY